MPDDLELVLFSTDPTTVRRSVAAGIDAFICDWESRGKEVRQAGADTEVNRETPGDLRRLLEGGAPKRYCRINRFGPWTEREVGAALASGATHILLPMVNTAAEAESFLGFVSGKAKAGILVETENAVERVDSLTALPVDCVYVGLNDLMISRASTELFRPLVDGTVDRIREAFRDRPMGLAGLTVLDGGVPVPCRLILQELARQECAFTFLRRSFRQDIESRELAAEIARIRGEWRRLRARTCREVEADHQRLCSYLRELYGR